MDFSAAGGAPFSDSSRRLQQYKTVIAFLLVGAAAYVWWPQHRVASKTISAQPFFVPQFDTKSEEAWMAGQIGRDILETVVFAVTRKHPANTDMQVRGETTLDGKTFELTGKFHGLPEVRVSAGIANYFWSPGTFAPWAVAILNASHSKPAETAERFDPDYFSRLARPMPETFTLEDRRLSKGLTKEPLDPELHEQAALLIGSFAMRQHAAPVFCDLRRHMCKMTAHLALAKAVRGNLGPCGILAEAILSSLAGRETPAIQAVDELQQKSAELGVPEAFLATWNRALRMRNTGDYRLLKDPENGSLLERLEYVRALRHSVDSASASKFVLTHDLERLGEWSAVILGNNFSVADGNRWAMRAMQTEFGEYSAQYRNYFGKPLGHEEMVDSLNIPWEQFSTTQEAAAMNVLGWGAWAEQHQRQICGLIENSSCWLGKLLGLNREAAEFEKRFTDQFRSLRLFPLVRFYSTRDNRSAQEFAGRARSMAEQHPELVTYQQWEAADKEMMRIAPRMALNQPGQPRRKSKQTATEAAKNVVKPDLLFARFHWFRPAMPVGTLYEAWCRLESSGIQGAPGSDIEATKALAPSNEDVLMLHLQQTTKHKPNAEQTEAEFNRLSGYSLHAMRMVANASMADPVRYARAYAPICWFDPDRYIELGDYLLKHSDETGAVKAYQNAFDYATDRVYVSNSMAWLINYYFDHARTDDAMRIANAGADVYSQTGLVTMSSLLDRMGKLDLAEWYLKKSLDRYPESTKDDLLDFYVRNRDKSAAYASAADRLRGEFFPNGIQTATLADFHGPPQDGVLLVTPSDRTAKAELKKGDIFVSLNGYRIHTMEQYGAARCPRNNPNVTFILWRDGNYMELKTVFPKRPDTSWFQSYSALPAGTKN